MKLKWQINDEKPIIKELDDFDLAEIKLCLMPSEVIAEVKYLDLLKRNLLSYQRTTESHGIKLGIQICIDEIDKILDIEHKEVE